MERLTIFGVNAWDLATDFWSFLLKQIGPTLYARRMKFGANIEGNGLELWRKLYMEYHGSDELLQVAGRFLHRFFAGILPPAAHHRSHPHYRQGVITS